MLKLKCKCLNTMHDHIKQKGGSEDLVFEVCADTIKDPELLELG